jgi:hypothetical protein
MVDKIRERPADDFQRVHIIFLGEFFRSLPDLELQAVFLKILDNLPNTPEVFREDFEEFLRAQHAIEGYTWNVARHNTDGPAPESRYLLHGRIPIQHEPDKHPIRTTPKSQV